MPIYNKLVRDLIPQIIQEDGKKCTMKILDDNSYKNELRKKLSEEMEEYISATSNEEALEELADLLELMHALAGIHGVEFEKVEQIRKEKATKRGGFKEKVFLIEVDDE